MNAQILTQAAVTFVVSVTCTNIFINFVCLGIEEAKKCSIMKNERQKENGFLAGKKKKYAVLKVAEKIA